ncbi:MAG: dephospho-CoA kinase, partial [Dehalococcoidia bacterium]
DRGATIVDADKVGHEVYKPGSEGWQKVVDAFGQQVVAENGEIDRKALGAIVFGDPAQRDRLQSIVWPVMKGMMARMIADFRTQNAHVVVIEAAVLLEAGWQDLVEKLWVVTVPPAVAEARLITRNGLTSAQAQARIAAQLSNEERTRHADAVIDNSGSVADAIARVAQLWDQLAVAGAR